MVVSTSSYSHLKSYSASQKQYQETFLHWKRWLNLCMASGVSCVYLLCALLYTLSLIDVNTAAHHEEE